MSDTIIAAIIGATATLVAALLACWIALRTQHRKRGPGKPKRSSNSTSDVPEGLPGRVINAVNDGLLREPFSAADVTRLFPAEIYDSFLPNNAEGGNYGTGHFVRVETGLYRIANHWRHD